MKFTFESKYPREWCDEFMCICYMENSSSRLFSLSKRKMLRYLSEFETLDKMHVLILDTLSAVSKITYYMIDNIFIIYTQNDQEKISFILPQRAFDDILLNCILRQY